jgi:N-acetylmuramic acid 6-phosphate etherase
VTAGPHQLNPIEAPTERRNPATVDLDLLPTLDLLRMVNAEDAVVAAAVERALPAVAEAVDTAVEVLAGGGRIHYFGAGTSGRIAAMDAAELPPTFAIDPDRVVAHHAGGAEALDSAMEDVEDDEASGRAEAADVRRGDLVLGLTASGRTPFVYGALAAAQATGAATVLVSSNPDATIADVADVHICVETGPEALTGSTRMKAGTAQKLVLNAFSTAVMVRSGRTYSNLMIHVVAKNAKLHGRMVTILMQATGQDEPTCARMLRESDRDLSVALVRMLGHVDADRARDLLAANNGTVRAALAGLGAAAEDTSGNGTGAGRATAAAAAAGPGVSHEHTGEPTFPSPDGTSERDGR